MFEVGFSELLLIMGLALLVLGPEKLPKVVSEIGRWMGRARAMARQFREQLEVEAHETARRKNESAGSSTQDSNAVPPAPTSEGAPPTEQGTPTDATPSDASGTDAPSTDTPATPTPSAVEDYVNRHPDDQSRG